MARHTRDTFRILGIHRHFIHSLGNFRNRQIRIPGAWEYYSMMSRVVRVTGLASYTMQSNLHVHLQEVQMCSHACCAERSAVSTMVLLLVSSHSVVPASLEPSTGRCCSHSGWKSDCFMPGNTGMKKAGIPMHSGISEMK